MNRQLQFNEVQACSHADWTYVWQLGTLVP